MPMYIAPFVKDLDNFIEQEVPQEFAIRQINSAVYLLKRFRHYTPKLTTHAMRNWQLTADFKLTRELGFRDNKEGTTTAPLFTENEIRHTLGEIGFGAGSKMTVGVKKGAKKTSTFYVYNNVRYMQALVDGHSRKAPTYWFYIALNETRDYMASQMAKYYKRKGIQ